MPSDDQIEGALDQIADVLESVGDAVDGIKGPITDDSETLENDSTNDNAEIETDEQPEEQQYYLLGNSEGSSFYIAASTAVEHMTIVYPFNSVRYVGRSVVETDAFSVDEMLNSHSDAEVDPGTMGTEDEYIQVGQEILTTTDRSTLDHLAFFISAYGSSEAIAIDVDSSTLSFTCHRALYPYTEPITIQEVSDRLDSVINAGRRAKRYVQTSMYVTESDESNRLTLGYRF